MKLPDEIRLLFFKPLTGRCFDHDRFGCQVCLEAAQSMAEPITNPGTDAQEKVRTPSETDPGEKPGGQS